MTNMTASETAISLTAAEHNALPFAAGMLRARADDLGPGLAAIADVMRGEAHVLQGLHDRWHRARVVGRDGRPHDGCSWCANGAAR